jgi:single-strand DNA-binding protein
METQNLVRLCGYVAKDIESKQYRSGHRVALRIATPETLNGPGADQQDRSSWHDVIAWDELADQAIAEFGKGSKIEVEGRLAYRSYTGDDGLRKLFVFVKAQFLNHPDK